MAIISQETWDNMPKEEKVKIVESYNSFSEAPGDLKHWIKGGLESIFGKENLQSNIRTWTDVAIYNPKLWDDINTLGKAIASCPNVDNKLYKKLIATIQIQKLIKIRYGGVVTPEEWDDQWIEIWFIRNDPAGNLIIDSSFSAWHRFVSFHTKEQAQEFISYPENLELLKDFYKP